MILSANHALTTLALEDLFYFLIFSSSSRAPIVSFAPAERVVPVDGKGKSSDDEREKFGDKIEKPQEPSCLSGFHCTRGTHRIYLHHGPKPMPRTPFMAGKCCGQSGR